MKVRIYWVLLCFCSILVLYYSWLVEPSFKNEAYLPSWLIEWTDLHGQLRTAIPFIFIGLICFLLHKNKMKAFCYLVTFSFLLVSTAEIGQLFLPHRFPDFMDIFFGLLGSIIGFSCLLIIKCVSANE